MYNSLNTNPVCCVNDYAPAYFAPNLYMCGMYIVPVKNLRTCCVLSQSMYARRSAAQAISLCNDVGRGRIISSIIRPRPMSLKSLIRG